MFPEKPPAASYIVCLSLSLLLCIASLLQLWTFRKARIRSLFWIQLVFLALSDLLFSLFSLSWGILRWADVMPLPSEFCHWLWRCRVSLEFFSCMIEVHIAAGFAITCFHNQRLSVLLWRALPVTFPLAFVLSWLIEPELNSEGQCRYTHYSLHNYAMMVWISIVLSCCLLSVLLYTASVIKTAMAPTAIRRRAQLRGLTYVLNFVLTFGVRAITNFYIGHTWIPPALLSITGDCIALNGALNVVTYNFWMWHTKRLAAHASMTDGLGGAVALEDWAIDRYFDLDVYSDEFIFEAQQQAALSIASFRTVLRQENLGASLQPTP